MRIKLQPGMICIYDPQNKSNFDITMPIQVELISKVKRNLWKCKNLDSDSNIDFLIVKTKKLIPIATGIIRIPNLPTLTKDDKLILNTAVDILEETYKTLGKLEDQNIVIFINKFKQICEKIDLLIKIREPEV